MSSMKLTGVILASLALSAQLPADDFAKKLPQPVQVDTWNGYQRYSFQVNGCTGWIVRPKGESAKGNPWSWCMEFPTAFLDRCAALELLQAGYHHCHVQVGNTFGCPAAQETFKQFYGILQQAGLAKKGALIGISRGGLYAYRFAVCTPGAVNVIYGDAPVCDFKSWPGGKGKGVGSAPDWTSLQSYYHFGTEADALAYKGNPIDILDQIAAQGIKLVHVVGDADVVVPWEENTAIVEERYRKLGGVMEVYHKPGCGHHPHGLEDSSPVVAFILKHNQP